jgi:hypothetical protein
MNGGFRGLRIEARTAVMSAMSRDTISVTDTLGRLLLAFHRDPDFASQRFLDGAFLCDLEQLLSLLPR